VKCGVLYNFTTNSHEYSAAAGVYREQLDQIAMVDGLGFDSVWMSEHHFAESCYMPSPLPMAGAVAMRTSQVEIGIGIVPMPFYNPIRLAEDCAVLDNLSGGRFFVGLGLGYRDEEYDGFGFNRRHRAAYTQEAIAVIRGCWGIEPFSHKGRFFEIDNVNCTPKPINGSVPLWLSGTAPVAVQRAARHGDGWFGIGMSPEILDTYYTALAEAGRDRANVPVAGMPLTWIYVTEDPERDRAVLEPYAVAEARLFTSWASPLHDLDSLGAIDPYTMVHIGTPDQILNEIEALQNSTPIDHLVFVPNLRGAPIEIANRSLELFAEQVLPRLA
jgi:alkanesulfonate monooxygenase SsuD/methylene tetrahydromethanopterin reductase-like flavin-dependent oxidoreductase (luciferase family)